MNLVGSYLGSYARQKESPESLGRHVKLDKGGHDGDAVETRITRRRHGDQTFDARQSNRRTA